jgi:GNAT superfamily N-acetyltransferase
VHSVSTRPLVRRAFLGGQDSAKVGRLVEAYLRQTEREKAAHLYGAPFSDIDELPASYGAEAASPEAAYAGSSVYLAELGSTAVGVAVVRKAEDATEIKRLWADPGARGRGVGSALIDAVLQEHPEPVRLSVWDWRNEAMRLYMSRGFIRIPSWDERPRLVCMERAAAAAASERYLS